MNKALTWPTSARQRENTNGTNGLFPLKDGRLLAAEGTGARIVAVTADGRVTALASEVAGKPDGGVGNKRPFVKLREPEQGSLGLRSRADLVGACGWSPTLDLPRTNCTKSRPWYSCTRPTVRLTHEWSALDQESARLIRNVATKAKHPRFTFMRHWRMIYYWAARDAAFNMLYAYAKNEPGDLTPKQAGVFAQLIREEFK